MLMTPQRPIKPYGFKTSAKARLTYYRNLASHYNSSDWRKLRGRYGSTIWSNWSEDRTKIYTDNIDHIGHDLGPAHNLVSLRHTGWYTDGFQQDTLCGHVVRLRTPKGTMYIPATVHSEWDGVTLYIGDAILVDKGVQDEDAHEEAAREAARDADHYAEREAEECREDWTKQEAEHEVETKRQENTELAKAIREIKRRMEDEENCFDPYLRGVLQDKIDEHFAEINGNVRRMSKLRDEPWIVNNNW